MKKALITIAMGDEFERIAMVTHPTLQRYAERIGADFIVWGKPQLGLHIHPAFIKLDIHRELETYDRVLFVDSDIIIRDNAPDLFELVPVDQVGLMRDQQNSWASVMEQYCRNAGVNNCWNGKYYNTGVMMVSRSHRCLFEQPPREIISFYEQTYLNLQLSRYQLPVFELPWQFNRLYSLDLKEPPRRLHAYFVHYSGTAGLNQTDAILGLMRSDLEEWQALDKTFSPIFSESLSDSKS